MTKRNRINIPTNSLTKGGRIRSMFTLKCWFIDGNQMTYRGDMVLEELQKKKLPLTNQVQALSYKFNRIVHRVETAIIYDNRKQKPDDVLMQYELGVFVKDERPKKNAR